MPWGKGRCAEPGCPTIVSRGRCAQHATKAERRRGGHDLRGGGNSTHWRIRRRVCLLRDPVCVCTDTDCGHGGRCFSASTVADHWPISKRDLVARGDKDPDAAHHLRGLCAPCHNRSTAKESPSGFRNK